MIWFLSLLLLIAPPAYADTVMLVGFGATSSYPCSHDQLGGTESNIVNFIRAAAYQYGTKITTCTSATRTVAFGGDGATSSDGYKLVRNNNGTPYYYSGDADWALEGTTTGYDLKIEVDITSSTEASVTFYVGAVQGTPGTATVRISKSDTLDLSSDYCSGTISITGTGTYGPVSFTGCDFED
jgi:hypothetical protein